MNIFSDFEKNKKNQTSSPGDFNAFSNFHKELEEEEQGLFSWFHKNRGQFAEIDTMTSAHIEPDAPPEIIGTRGGEIRPREREYIEPRDLSTWEQLLYVPTRMASNIKRDVFQATETMNRGIRGALEFLGAEETPRLDSTIEKLGSIREDSRLINYADELADQRRISAHNKGTTTRILNDLGDTGIDLLTLMFSMKMLGAGFGGKQAATGGIQSVGGKSIAERMTHFGKMAGHAFTTSPGEDIEDKLEAAQMRLMYNLTPFVAQATGAVGMGAVMLDFGLNAALTSPQYKEAWEKSGGRPNDEFLSMAIPQMATDLVMAFGTRGLPRNIAEKHWEKSGVDSLREAYDLDKKQAKNVFGEMHDIARQIDRGELNIDRQVERFANEFDMSRDGARDLLLGVTDNPQTSKEIQYTIMDKDQSIDIYRELLRDDDLTDQERQTVQERLEKDLTERNELRDKLLDENTIQGLRHEAVEGIQQGEYMARDRLQKLEELILERSEQEPAAQFIGVKEDVALERAYRQEVERVREAYLDLDERYSEAVERTERLIEEGANEEVIKEAQSREEMMRQSRKQLMEVMAQRKQLDDLKIPDSFFYDRQSRIVRPGDFAKPDAYKDIIENMHQYRDELRMKLDITRSQVERDGETPERTQRIEALERLQRSIGEREQEMMEYYRTNIDRDKEAINVSQEREAEIAQRLETLMDKLDNKAHPALHERYVSQLARDMGIEPTRTSPEEYDIQKVGFDEIPDTYQADNFGYHAGNLGKAETIQSLESTRSTGHFGTGTYFFGSKESPGFEGYAERRPVYRIDLSDYNLFRPDNSRTARELHDFLKEINRVVLGSKGLDDISTPLWMVREDDITPSINTDSWVLRQIAKNTGMDTIDYHWFRNKLTEMRDDYREEFQKASPWREPIETPATRFMKELGWEGIDVRGIDEVDNSRYGSVVYDFKVDGVREFFRDSDALELIDRKIRNTLYGRPVSANEVSNYDQSQMVLRDYQKLDSVSLEQMVRESGLSSPESIQREVNLLRDSFKEVEDKEISLSEHDEYWQTIMDMMGITKDMPHAEYLYRQIMEWMYVDDVNVEMIRQAQGISFREFTPEDIRSTVRNNISEGYGGSFMVKTADEERLYKNEDIDLIVKDINATLEERPDAVFAIYGRPGEDGYWGDADLKAEIRADMYKEETGEPYTLYDMQDTTFEKAHSTITRIDELESQRTKTNDDSERKQLNSQIEKLLEEKKRLDEENGIRNSSILESYIEKRKGMEQQKAQDFMQNFLNVEKDEDGNWQLENLEVDWGSVRQYRVTPENRESFPVSIRELKDFVYDEIAPVHRGKSIKDGASGVYNAYKKLIEISRVDDIDTLKHEVGHAIEQHYDIVKNIGQDLQREEGQRQFNSPRLLQELMNRYEARFDPDTYPDSVKLHEGFSEFFKAYTSDKDWARQLSPNLFKHFEEVLARDTNMQEVVQQFADMGHRWDNMTSAQKVQAHITRSDKSGWDLSVKDKVAEMFKDKATSLRRMEMDYIKNSTREMEKMSRGNLDTLPELPVTMSPYRTYFRYRASYQPMLDTYLHKGAIDPLTYKVIDGSKSIMGALEPVKEYLGDDNQIGFFETFIVALHGLEREAIGKHSFANIEMTGVQKLIETIGEVGQQKFIRAARDLKEIRDHQLDFMEFHGMISKEAVERIKPTYQFYIPMERALDQRKSTLNISGERLSNSPQLVRNAFGSDALIRDPIQTLIRNTNYMVRESLKNQVKQNIYRLGEARGMGKWVEDVTPERDPRTKREAEREGEDTARRIGKEVGIDEFLKRHFGEIPEREKDQLTDWINREYNISEERNTNQIDTWVRQNWEMLREDFVEKFYEDTGLDEFFTDRLLSAEFMERANQSDVHQVKIDGQTRLFRVRNENLNRFLNNEMDDKGSTFNPLVKFLEKSTGIFKAGSVVNPRFPLRNLFRDQFTGMFNTSKDEGWFIPVKETLTGLMNKAPEGTSDAHWRNLGGSRGGIGDYVFKLHEKEFAPMDILEKDKGWNAFQMFQNLSRWSEDGTRKGHFYRLYKEKDIENMAPEMQRIHAIEAAEASRAHINLDYQRKGYVVESLDKTGLFLAPWMNSFFKTMDLMRTRPGETLLKGLSMFTLPYMLNYWYNRDNEEFLEMPVWRKLVSFPLNIGDRFIYLPVPFFPAQMFGAIPTALMESIHKKDRDMFNEVFKNLPKFVLPDPTPPITIALAEMMTNTSFFSDRPIVPAGEERLPAHMQYGDYTSNIAKTVGGLIGFSPRHIDNLVRGTLSSVGSDILSTGDLVTGKIGPGEYIGRIFPFTGEHYTQARSIDQFYKERERAQGIIQTYDAQIKRYGEAKDYSRREYMEAQRLWSRYNNYAQQISTLRRQKENIKNNPHITDEEKEVRIDRLDMRMLNLARTALGEDRIIKR